LGRAREAERILRGGAPTTPRRCRKKTFTRTSKVTYTTVSVPWGRKNYFGRISDSFWTSVLRRLTVITVNRNRVHLFSETDLLIQHEPIGLVHVFQKRVYLYKTNLSMSRSEKQALRNALCSECTMLCMSRSEKQRVGHIPRCSSTFYK
jgi:hypothetical protein